MLLLCSIKLANLHSVLHTRMPEQDGTITEKTYKAVEADPVWMSLTTGVALNLEGIVVRRLVGIGGTKFGDSI